MQCIGQTISPIHSLFVAQRPSTYAKGEHGKILERPEVGCGKVACWSTKAAISLKRVKIEENLLWRAYRKSLTLFRTVPFRPPTLPFSVDWRFANPAQFAQYIHRVHPNKSRLNICPYPETVQFLGGTPCYFRKE